MPTFEVRQTVTDAKWFDELRDLRARAQILRRIERLEVGNPGDIAPVGEGVRELRVNVGPGYRVYLTRREGLWLLLLCGGDKGSQARDIAAAKRMARELDP